MKLNTKLIPIGKYLEEFKNYLPYNLKNDIIYRSVGLEKHILKRHPDCLQYIDLIPIIVSNPDYIGINPNEQHISFELVKVATPHTITDSKLQHSIQNGRLRKFDKTIDTSYNQDA